MIKLFKNTLFQIVALAVVVVLVTWGLIALLSGHKSDYSAISVARRDLVQTVTATGNVTADKSVTLAFNMQGKVSDVYAEVGSTTKVGEVLASLDTGTLQAALNGAEADVEAAQAHLNRLQEGSRPEELAIYQQRYDDASLALTSAMKSAYLAMEDAVVSKADTLFTNGNTVNPMINIHTDSETGKTAIEQERAALRDGLANLKSVLSSSTLAFARMTTDDELSSAKIFLDDLGLITDSLTTGNSGQIQSTIDGERAIVNGASQEVTGATSAEQAADAAWSAARDALSLEKAGSTAEDIQAGQAAVDKAQAEVDGLQNQIKQSSIVSTIDGIITDVNVKVGEIYVPGLSAAEGISLISDGRYKIKVYVPETDIGKINMDDQVSVTFDAYGPSVLFAAHVSLVDPAETLENGINAYKVTIYFDNPSDARIKSGLTANVVIVTKTAKDALVVPTRAIVTRGSNTLVLVKQAASGSYTEKSVKTGITSGDGYTEILSGLNEGDVIAGFGSGQ